MKVKMKLKMTAKMGYPPSFFYCEWPLCFQYMLSGWDGSAADASLYNDAHQHDLSIPEGRYYLTDEGFGACDALLVPYRGIRYHLAEWGLASVRYNSKSHKITIDIFANFPLFIGLPTERNYIISGMHLQGMLSKGYLASSRSTLSFWEPMLQIIAYNIVKNCVQNGL